MLAGGAQGASGVIGGKLYVYSTTTQYATFQRYDPATNTWAYMLCLAIRHRDECFVSVSVN